jgi:hypothetical protein
MAWWSYSKKPVSFFGDIRPGLDFCFSFPIAGEWFLSKLLAYRRDFIYVGALSTSSKGAKISWVDVILATIAETSVCISSGTSHVDGMEGTLARHKEEEAIRAVSQLPCRSSLRYDIFVTNRIEIPGPKCWTF